MDYDSKVDTQLHIDEVTKRLEYISRQLEVRGITHDASKLLTPEKEIFDEYVPKLKECEFGSKEYNEYKKEMGVAIDHHYKHNRHHPEYFKNGMSEMNIIDLIEMICDWHAAALRNKNGDPVKSCDVNKERFEIPDMLVSIIKNTMKDLNKLT